MEYTISNDKGRDACVVVLTGNVDVQSAITILDSVWQDETYSTARYVIWDLEACDYFPDFNEFVLIVNHARNNKPKNGPSRIAFCSTTFENSMLVKVLKGFTYALPQKTQLFVNQSEALKWFATTESDAA